MRHNNGQVVLWTMDGAQITNNQSIANLGLDWNIVGTGDFGGDGKDDVLLRNDNGQVVIWGMDGATIVSNQSVETPSNVWQVQDVGDYNGDSRSDILWRHDSGQVVIWEMNGSHDRREPRSVTAGPTRKDRTRLDGAKSPLRSVLIGLHCHRRIVTASAAR